MTVWDFIVNHNIDEETSAEVTIVLNEDRELGFSEDDTNVEGVLNVFGSCELLEARYIHEIVMVDTDYGEEFDTVEKVFITLDGRW